MKQADLNRAVARATGETVSFVDKMGFSLIVTPTPRQPRRQASNQGPIRSSHAQRRSTQRQLAHAA
jgi:hypothetical protein